MAKVPKLFKYFDDLQADINEVAAVASMNALELFDIKILRPLARGTSEDLTQKQVLELADWFTKSIKVQLTHEIKNRWR